MSRPLFPAHRLAFLAAIALLPSEVSPQQRAGLIVTIAAESVSVAAVDLLVRVAGAGGEERPAQRLVLRLSGRFAGSTEAWHQEVKLKVGEIQALTFSGDWCASPRGGLDIRLRNGTRHVLAGPGPTRYEERQGKPRPGTFDKVMAIDSWELQGEKARTAEGTALPMTLEGVAGRTATGAERRVPLCELRRIVFP